jgi:LacI family transcriptional regulator
VGSNEDAVPPVSAYSHNINDFTAIGIYQAVSEMGMKVGADIAVTGFDNTPISARMRLTYRASEN